MDTKHQIEEQQALLTELRAEWRRMTDKADNYRAMSYEQERPQAQAAYMNASVIARGQAVSVQREIYATEDRLRQLQRDAGVVVLTADQTAGMDDAGGLLGLPV